MDHEQTQQASAAQSQTVENNATHPEHTQVLTTGSGESNGVAGRDASQRSSTYVLNAASEGHPTLPRSPESPSADFERVPVARPARSRNGQTRVSFQRQSLISNAGLPAASQNVSGIDWIVPVEPKGDVSVVFIFWMAYLRGHASLGAPHRR